MFKPCQKSLVTSLAIGWLVVLGVSTALAGERDIQVRAIWVTRWDYKTPADVRKIISNCAALRFNVILFQVRGNGTVFYRSTIEPWAWELTSEGPETTGKDPGWDPLKLAIREAHKRGIELHAYVNVFPAWLSKKYPPRDSGQLWWEHPDWFMCDAAGYRMLPRDKELDEGVKRDWYSFISPGVPEVQDYLVELFTELATQYDIDGLHYDYIRYPKEITEVKAGYEDRVKRLGNWSYDAVSLARFSKDTGIAAPDLDPQAWVDWRAAQITEVVRRTSEQVRRVRPDIIISAAVMADPDDAYRTKMQDYVRWMKEGYLDAAITMNYTGNNELFEKRCKVLLDRRPARGWVVAGMSFAGQAETIYEQVGITRALKTDGFAGFAYSHLFDRDNKHQPKPLAEALAKGLMPGRTDTPWRKSR
ncbi:MAG: hypothetical protein Kow00105_00110 [Phycisphaeraceae bacterium]